MSTRSPDERAASRAEARRRARMVARGELGEDEVEAIEPEPQSRGGLLTRLFPPAPPLPNRPDPLAGFDPSGPLRPIRERAFLLRHNLLAWLLPGILAFVGYIASLFYQANILGLLGTFVLFGSLIAAGWFGWQRPTLFGTAASLVSYVLVTSLILVQLGQMGADVETLGPDRVIPDLVLRALYQAGLGFLGGWYGGYLRRRQTQMSATDTRRRGR
ncbi:MAG TPA: hypothetical protein VJ975_11190 [Candidatus Limnocylindria bacterium]|nr:hypothetical protein [Candidatus Limnocylindria bacterium]